MTGPGPIALRAAAIAEAEAERGVAEVGGNNRGPEVEAYLAAVGTQPGAPWCAAFVRWCLERAANRPDLPMGFPDTGWSPSMAAWAMDRKLWIPALGALRGVGSDLPQRGDLALFYFAAKGRVAHVGIVTAEPDVHGWFRTVEGNTAPDKAEAVGGVARDGDGVYAKGRTLAALGLRGGFARLPW